MNPDLVALSKTISRALRHAPADYGLTLDSEGWVPLSDLLLALRSRRASWHNLQEANLVHLNTISDKQRFEIRDGRIRALYGHSLPRTAPRVPDMPPPLLFHGTASRFLDAIRRQGLRPMRRQYVHLSVDEGTARSVGRRKGGHTVILEVDARGAYDNGIGFYKGGEEIWLADAIPPRFIRF